MKIDYVIPYVDSKDEEWQNLFQIYYKQEYSKIKSFRFDNNTLFKYIFRGIEKNMPWINNVFLIVQSEKQVPAWINKDYVKIIKHEDFIPAEFLPVFNSCTIECFMHLIPGLSNFFIYGNDDTYVMNKLSEKDFFENIMPKCSLKNHFYKIEFENSHIRMCRNMLKIIGNDLNFKIPDNFFCAPKHFQQPFSKIINKMIFDKFKKEIYESITRFRNEKNISQYFFTLYYFYSTGKKYTNSIPGISLDLNDNTIDQIIKRIKSKQLKLLCLNNNFNNNELVFLNTFNMLFPEKSIYEN